MGRVAAGGRAELSYLAKLRAQLAAGERRVHRLTVRRNEAFDALNAAEPAQQRRMNRRFLAAQDELDEATTAQRKTAVQLALEERRLMSPDAMLEFR